MRLHSLNTENSHLLGSADGFLSSGWTALTSLRLDGSRIEDDVLTALNLQALEALSTNGFQHRGGALQPDQLCCPQLRSLAFQLDSSPMKEGSRRCYSLLSLVRLATLIIKFDDSHQAIRDFGPACQPHAPDHAGYFGQCTP